MVVPVTVSGESSTAEEFGLGRGNRRRKRRRFFDEDDDGDADDNDEEDGGIHPAGNNGGGKTSRSNNGHSGANASNGEEAVLRKSVFRPSYNPSHSTHSESSDSGGHQVAAAGKVPAVTRRRFSAWPPSEVAGLVRTLAPTLPVLAADRLVEEEVDGEAFLLLTQADLVSFLGLRLGPALKLYSAVRKVREGIRS